MAEQKIYEGRAELNIAPFLESLLKMEQESQKSVGGIKKQFEALDKALSSSLTGINNRLRSLASGMEQAGRSISKTAGQNSTSSRQMTQSADAQAAAAQRSADAAVRLAQAQARGLAIAKDYAKAVTTIEDALKANPAASAQAAQTAENQIAALRQRIAAADQRADQQAAQQAQQAANQRVRQVQQSSQQELSAKTAAARQELDVLRGALSDEQRLLDAALSTRLAQAKSGGYQQVGLLRQQLAEQTKVIEQSIRDQQQKRQAAEAIAARQQKLGSAAGGPASGFSADVYASAVAAAEKAQAREAALRRQLTSIAQTEAQAMRLAIAKGYDVEEKRQQALNGQKGFFAALKAGVEQARIDLKQLEDSWNSIYRAGSQLSQLGGMLTIFSGALTALGIGLVKSGGDFDFWVRRATAATQAANEQAGIAASQVKVTADDFRDAMLQVGRGIGVVEPAKVAESWYTYQAALGSSVETAEDLAQAHYNVDRALKAAVVSNTDVSVVIRGVTSAMGEFGLGTSQFEYALAVMNQTTQVTQAELSDMLEGFKMVGPQAKRLGLDIADVAAIFGVLATNGIRGSQAGRLLASGMGNIVKPSQQADDAMQHLLITQRGLTGSWRELVFDQNGKLNITAFLKNFVDATKGMGAAQKEFYTASLFGKEAGKVWSTLIDDYRRSGEQFEQTRDMFKDPQQMVKSFGEQWEEVAKSSKVQMGLMTYAFQELGERLSVILTTSLLPLLDTVRKLVYGFLDWAKTHPEVASGLVKAAIAVALITGVLGPMLAALGFAIQGAAGLALAWQSLSSIGTTVRAALLSIQVLMGPLAATMGGLLIPIALIAAALVALFLAWRYNWFGMRDTLGEVVGQLGNMVLALGSAVGAVLTIITGLFNGSDDLVRQGGRELAVALLEIVYVIPNEIAKSLEKTIRQLGTWLNTTMTSLARNLGVWGYNLMISLANGLVEGARAVYRAAESVAEGIARYFRSFSPPKYGPLRGIKVWGTNLINTLIEGMQAADFQAITQMSDRIGESLKRNIADKIAEPSIYAGTMGAANNLIDDMLRIVRDGGKVNADFFSSLKSGLGEWYEYISQIAMAYQEVYANERQLAIEKEKLAAIKAQREELDKQNQARQTAFDKFLGQTDATNVVNNTEAMVDPTTAEGQAKIAEMRKNLSKEDFQNWINFQKRLWEQRAAIEDEGLQKQEENIQAQVDTYQQQLDAAQKQYETYVAMYEYAVKMYELAEEQAELEKQMAAEREKEKKEKLEPPVGKPEDLKQFAEEIAKAVGGDQAILDEGTLRDRRGGDDIAAYGDAAKQREREDSRLSELEKLNRRKRAEFEVQIINATSAEERRRVEQMRDAWDAAYREEKARLQERAQLAQEVQDAAEKQADASEAGRIGAEEARYQKEIKDLLGEQTEHIDDANELKGKSKDLDEAELKARAQMREEERALRDLQAYGDQKKLEFEQRIRDAANDPEKLRRIKEEQDAWETAYKKATELQQARVEAARRAQQDLADQRAAQEEEARKKKEAEGEEGFKDPFAGGGGGAAGVTPLDGAALGDFGANIGKDLFSGLLPKIDEVRPTSLKAIEAFENLKRAIGYLTDDTIPAAEKLTTLADTVKEALGWDTWWDALAPKEQRQALSKWLDDVVNRIGSFGADSGVFGWLDKMAGPENPFFKLVNSLDQTVQGVLQGWDLDGWAQEVQTSWGKFTGWLSGWFGGTETDWKANLGLISLTNSTWFAEQVSSWGNWFLEMGTGAGTWLAEQKASWGTWFGELGTSASTWLSEQKTSWGTWFGDIGTNASTWWGEQKTGWGTYFSDVATDAQNHWTGVKNWFSENFAAPFSEGWNTYWTERKTTWGSIFSAPFATDWTTFWTERKTGWGTTFSAPFSTDWSALWDTSLSDWTNNFSIPFSVDWGALWTDLKAKWTTFKETYLPDWEGLWTAMRSAWDEFFGPFKVAWDGFISSLDRVFRPIRDFINDLANIRFPSMPSWLGGGGGQSSGGGGGSGAGYANGLDFVPFNGFRAVLHQGERVLTAAEAAVYNQMEAAAKTGSAVTRAIAGATTQNNSTREVNIHVDRIDASNPSEGRAFLQQVAFAAP